MLITLNKEYLPPPLGKGLNLTVKNMTIISNDNVHANRKEQECKINGVGLPQVGVSVDHSDPVNDEDKDE